AVTAWAERYDGELAKVLAAETDLALRALTVERDGHPNPRKDLKKWSDFRPVYGFFFPELFTVVNDPAQSPLAELPADAVRAFAAAFVETYRPIVDPQEWFDRIR